MKIAILCHASAGGSGVVATELALALAGLGHTVHVIAAERPFRLTEERLHSALRDLGSEPPPQSVLARLVQQGSQSVRNWLGRIVKRSVGPAAKLHFHEFLSADYPLFKDSLVTLTAANSLAKVIEEHGIEIVHAHYAIPHATSALLARDMGLPIKVVTTLHGTDVTLMGLEPAFALTTKHAILQSDAVTAVSHALAEEARRSFAVDRPIEVVYNWVDTERFQPNTDPAYRARFAQPEEAILLHVSNFREVKRPLDVIRIFAGIAEVRPARLLMIGDGPKRAECQELAHQLELSGRVQFIEATPQIERFLAVADLFLLPSEQESFGLVALEAMACGVPVVASNAGGIPEVVLDGVTGLLRPVSDVPGMVQAALQILEDPARQRQMRQAAREWAMQQFRPESVLPRYLEIYQSVLEGHPTMAP